jgi:hypothetical protein
MGPSLKLEQHVGKDQITGFSASFVKFLLSFIDGNGVKWFKNKDDHDESIDASDHKQCIRWKGKPEIKIAFKLLAKQLEVLNDDEDPFSCGEFYPHKAHALICAADEIIGSIEKE